MHPVLLQLGDWRLFSYGALIALGGALSAAYWLSCWKAMGLRKREDVWLLVNVILISGFAGGKLLFLLEYDRSGLGFNSGFSVMGAFGSVALGVYLYSRALRLDFRRLLDYVCQAAPVWHAFGRLGCFAAGCCFGRPTQAPWAAVFTDPESMVPARLLGVPLHPAQLYEAAGDLVIAAGLYFFVRPGRGALAAWYFIAYALLRFFMEFFRGDIVATPFLGLTAAQVMTLALASAAAAWRISCIRS